MAYEPMKALEAYLIGKFGSGNTLYLVDREAYKNYKSHKANILITTVSGNSYNTGVSSTLTAYEFDKIPSNWPELFRRDNVELYKKFQAKYQPKPGKFDHIQPDKCIIQEYNTTGLYIVHVEDYNRGGHSTPAYVIHPDYSLKQTLSKSGCVNGKGIGTQKNYTYLELPQNRKNEFKKFSPELYKHFEYFYAKQVKSEPTPDDYYLVKHGPQNDWRIVLRKPWSEDKYVSRDKGQFLFWAKNDESTLGMHNKPEHQQYWIINNKKFPQLGLEIKQELRKLNPERYKEWEDFYVQKYPKFQRLEDEKPQCGCGTCKSCLERMPLPDPKDDYIIQGVDGWSLIKKSDLGKTPTPYYHLKRGWTTWASPINNGKPYPEFMSGKWAKDLNDGTWTLWNNIRDKFEQYYSELERKKAPEPLWINLPGKYNMNGKTPDMFYLYTTGMGWELARKEAINGIHKPDDRVMLIKIEDFSMREVKHSYISQWAGLPFEKMSKDQIANFKQQNPTLYGQWMHKMYSKSLRGSELDIDEKAMKANWQEYYNMVMNSPDTQGFSVVKARRIGQSKFYEDAKQMAKYYDRPDNRLLEEMVQYSWNMVKEDLNKTIDSQTNKQKQHEIIIVRRQTEPIISRQTIRGTATFSKRIEPTITRRYPSYNPQPVSGKERIGSREVRVSSKRSNNY